MQYCTDRQEDLSVIIRKLHEDVGSKPLSSILETIPTVRRIDPPQAESNDLLSRLRQTWIGRVYVNYLKQFFLARWAVQWIRRNGFPFYTNYLSIHFLPKNAKKWRTLVTVSDFAKKPFKQTYKLAESTVVETPAIQVIPAKDQDFLISPHNSYIFPEIFVTIVQNAMLYGGTNLILSGDEVLCHDLYDFERDYTSEELHGKTVIDPKTRRIRWLLHDEDPESIPVAAIFVDACALNYAHWMTEILPRICIFCSDEQFRDVPIIVDDGLHQNIMESLFLVAGSQRKIITLPIGRGLAVDQLYVTSATGYVPFDRRTNKLTNHSHGIFSPVALRLLAEHVKARGQQLYGDSSPRKIYLRRNSGIRKIINGLEIERWLVEHGFSVVEPERLTFLQQVSLFANAEVVVASSGAALANIVFCSQEAKIFIFISKLPEMIYWYWQNMANASGKVVNYILGDIVDGQTKGIHTDFRIDLDSISIEFEEAL